MLVLACFAAFFLTQRLKHTPTAVQSFKLTPLFSPYPAGHIKQEAISFKLAHADAVTVTIIDSAGNTVATLVRDQPVPRYKQFSLRWNGRRGTAHALLGRRTRRRARDPRAASTRARLAPPGEYRVRVSLPRQHRTLLLAAQLHAGGAVSGVALDARDEPARARGRSRSGSLVALVVIALLVC